MNEKKEDVFRPYGLFVWSLAILFYFYEFFLRVMPATISTNIIKDLNITLEKFAYISSAYYITYSLMQIPVGILIDRFGVRLLITIACSVCTIGIVGFAFSENFYNALISRLLIGFGSSFGYVSFIVLAFSWLPQRHFGFIIGIGQALGTIGPLVAGGPIIWMMNAVHDNWHLLFLFVALVGAILSFCIAVFVRNKPDPHADQIVFIEKRRSLMNDLKQLLKMPQIWVIMIYAGFIYVTLPLLGAYWGTLYLHTRGFSKATAGFLVSMIWIGLAIGSPLFGKFSDQIKRRKPILAAVGFCGAIASFLFLFLPTQNEWILAALLFFIGMSTSGQSLSFALITEHVPSELKATAMGANNTAVMLLAAVLPPLATMIIQSHVENKHVYEVSDFTTGFLLMPVAYLIAGIVCLFFVRETFCRGQHTIYHL